MWAYIFIFIFSLIIYTTIVHYAELQKTYSDKSLKKRLLYTVSDATNIEHLKSKDSFVNYRYDEKMQNGIKYFMKLFNFDIEMKYDFGVGSYKIVTESEDKKRFKRFLTISKILTALTMLFAPFIHFESKPSKRTVISLSCILFMTALSFLIIMLYSLGLLSIKKATIATPVELRYASIFIIISIILTTSDIKEYIKEKWNN